VDDWQNRRAPLDALFTAVNADIIGFQEMESFASADDGSVNLARDLLLDQNRAYAARASGDWQTFPSTQRIFYRRDRFTLLDQGWFFFSYTPDVIYSRAYGGSFPAFASTVRLQDTDGTILNVVNVHFEYKCGYNRLRPSALVADRIAPPIAGGERVALIGDINALAGSQTAQILQKAGFTFLPLDGSTYYLNRGMNLFGAIDHIALAGPMPAPPRRYNGASSTGAGHPITTLSWRIFRHVDAKSAQNLSDFLKLRPRSSPSEDDRMNARDR